MESLNLQKGVLITADPYSKIVDKEDKNTSLLFGDGAVALLDRDPMVIFVLKVSVIILKATKVLRSQ